MKIIDDFVADHKFYEARRFLEGMRKKEPTNEIYFQLGKIYFITQKPAAALFWLSNSNLLIARKLEETIWLKTGLRPITKSKAVEEYHYGLDNEEIEKLIENNKTEEWPIIEEWKGEAIKSNV